MGGGVKKKLVRRTWCIEVLKLGAEWKVNLMINGKVAFCCAKYIKHYKSILLEHSI